MQKIQGYEHYFVTTDGKIFSQAYGSLKELSPWLDSKKRYFMIDLSKKGTVYKHLVHRLVAQAYIPNPDNLPEVNHKDGNCQNNHVSNLEWVTRQENINHSLLTHSPVRNFKECFLYYENEFIGEFQSIAAAARYANEKTGASISSLSKYYTANGYTIVKKSNDHPERE